MLAPQNQSDREKERHRQQELARQHWRQRTEQGRQSTAVEQQQAREGRAKDGADRASEKPKERGGREL